MSRSGAESAGRPIWLWAVFIFGLSLFAPGLFGSPIPCAFDSYANYQSQGQCALGDYTVKGFTFSSSSTGGPTLLTASQIFVEPFANTPTNIALRFSTPGGFHVDPRQSEEYILRFELDPLLPSIGGPIIDLGPNDPVTYIGEFCGDGILGSAPKVQPVTCIVNGLSGVFPARLELDGTGAPATTSTLFPSLVTTMDNRLIVDLEGPANLDYFQWGASVQDGQAPVAVPEPSTSLILVPALLALGWLRKRWRVTAR